VSALQRPALWVFAALALAPLAAHFGSEAYGLDLATRAVIFAIAALALDYLIGQAGLVSFGHSAYLGMGAYAVAMLSSVGVDDMLVCLAVSVLAGAIFAAVTGVVSLRASGVYYIMSTLAFAQMLYFFAISLSAFGGDDGYTLPRRGTLFGRAALDNPRAFYAFALAVLIIVYVLIDRFVGSRFGRVLSAARQNALRAQATGFEPFRYQLVASALSGAIASIAGVLLAEQAGFVSPAYQSWQRSGELLAMTILGGVGSLWGPVVGAAVFVVLSEWLSTLSEHWRMILGPLLILVAIAGRGGLAGLVARFGARR
jgi:branched-chain amino acid transport system permease protein